MITPGFPLSLRFGNENGKSEKKGGGEGNGVTSLWHTVRLVLRSSLLSSPLIYFRTPPHGPSSSHFLPTSPIVYSHIPSPGLATGIFSLFICTLIHSYTLSISSNSFDEISKRSSWLLLRTKLLRLLLPSSLHIMILNAHPFYHSPSLLNSHHSPFPSPPVSHSFPILWILPSRWAFYCHHFDPLLQWRCNLCLAGPRIGCFFALSTLSSLRQAKIN